MTGIVDLVDQVDDNKSYGMGIVPEFSKSVSGRQPIYETKLMVGLADGSRERAGDGVIRGVRCTKVPGYTFRRALRYRAGDRLTPPYGLTPSTIMPSYG
jgi:hypothetical protein